MKRLALVLAATAALGTGCYSAPCRRSITVDWSGGFVQFDGTKVGCGAASGVAFIDLFINDDPNSGARIACSAGAAQAVDLPGGTNLITVEGIDSDAANPRILFRDEVQVPTACGDTPVNVTPSEGTLSVSYQLPGNACVSPGPSFIWLRVRDDIAGVIAADSSSAPETNDTCGDPAFFPLKLRLASGSYTLLSTEEVVRTNPAVFGNYSPVGRNCAASAFSIAAAGTTSLTPSLLDATAFCP